MARPHHHTTAREVCVWHSKFCKPSIDARCVDRRAHDGRYQPVALAGSNSLISHLPSPAGRLAAFLRDGPTHLISGKASKRAVVPTLPPGTHPKLPTPPRLPVCPLVCARCEGCSVLISVVLSSSRKGKKKKKKTVRKEMKQTRVASLSCVSLLTPRSEA